MEIPQMEQKLQKKFSVFKIIAFESGTANPENPKGIVLIGGQCVNKHP